MKRRRFINNSLAALAYGGAKKSFGQAFFGQSPWSTPGMLFITNGLLAWYRMSEGSGSTTADASGNGNTGTLVNTPSWISGVPNSLVSKYVLSFNGTSQSVDCGTSAGLQFTGNFSICAWIKPTVTLMIGGSNIYNIVSKTDNSTPAGYEMIFNTDGEGFVMGVHGGGSYNDWYADITFTSGTWYHVVVAWSGSATVGYLYVNGVLQSGTLRTTNLALASSTAHLGIGAWIAGGGRYFPGAIGDVRVYNRALSQQEITAIANLRG